MSNVTYDRLKFTALVALPAVATLYFAVAQIWHLPKAEEVVGTISAVDAFLGVLLGYASKRYNEGDAKYDGEILAQRTDRKVLVVNLNSPEEEISQKTEVRFKVIPK